jgi:hypothetical protein
MSVDDDDIEEGAGSTEEPATEITGPPAPEKPLLDQFNEFLTTTPVVPKATITAKQPAPVDPERSQLLDQFRQFLGATPLPDLPSAGHLDLKGGAGYVPEHRVRAVFTDEPGSSYTTEELAAELAKTSADEVRERKPRTFSQSIQDFATGKMTEKQRMAAIGGALQGATLGLGDEAAAGIGALAGKGSYRQLRDENREADKTASSWDRTLYGLGKLAGNAVTGSVLGPVAGKPLLSGANTIAAAELGGVQGLGESDADLTRGEVGKSIRDTILGAGAGVAANTVLGGGAKLSEGLKRYVAGLPEGLAKKADETLIDAATLGAPASQRDALMGPLGQDRGDVLKLIRSNPEVEAALEAGDRPRAALLIRQAQEQHAAAESDTIGKIQTAKGNIDVLPVLEKLESQRAELAANPSLESQAAAAKKQKLIDSIREKWMPEPPMPEPKGNELLGKLMDGADPGDKQRAGMKAADFLRVAKEAKLAKVVNDPEKTLATVEKSLDKMGKERTKLYDQLGEAADVPIGNVTAKLAEWRDELAKSASGLEDVPKVDNLIGRVWQAHGRDGRAGMPAEELRAEITKIQNKAFSGSYLDPNKSAEMGREAAGRMRQALDEHIAMIDRSMPPDSEVGRKLAALNQKYSPMLAFRDAAEKRASAARLKPVPPPETRTGTAGVSEARGLANATEDAEAKRALTGGLYQQVGPEASHQLAALDRQQELLQRLREPLEHKAAREASPSTTLRSATHKLGDIIGGTGATGVGAAGLTLAAAGHHVAGPSLVASALAMKYGPTLGAKAERAVAAMVQAQRMGANPGHLMTIAKIAGVPISVAKDLVAKVAPRAAVSAAIPHRRRQGAR